jgi:cobalamin biosynthesis Mg chelatase CobN
MAEYAAIAAAVAAVAGAAVSAGGAVYSGIQQQHQAQQQADVAEQQAQQAQIAGAAAEQQTRERSRQVMAAQRALLGGTGVTTEGTPLLTLLDTASQAELDALRARYTGQVRSFGELEQASLLRQRAGQYLTAGALGAGSTLLTGLGRTALTTAVPRDPYALYDTGL